MNKYWVNTNREEIKKILCELSKSLKFELDRIGKTVWVEQNGDGIYLKKKEGKIYIRYSKKSEFARAWYLMLRMDDKTAYEYYEKCRFDNLQVMLDCSRNAVMRPETVKMYIRYLAACGYHSIQLYTEDTLLMEKEPYVGYMRGAYTQEEIRQIDQYCQIFGMELIPCIQTLAHINQITRYEHYQKIIDVNDILLVGEEKTYEFLDHLLGTVAGAFSTRKINIGMDEAHMLGLGKYLDLHGYRERFGIMIEHLNRVRELLDKYGFEPMMWSDMFFRLLAKGKYELQEEQADEELFQLIPEGIELIYWDYYSMDYEHYYRNLKMHYRMAEQIGFAAGAWKWTGFAPENGFSLQAGEAAIKASIDAGVQKFIVTCWGDNGAEASAFSVLPSLFRYSEAAYTGQAMTVETEAEIKENNRNFRILTGIDFDQFMMVDLPNQIFGMGKHTHTNPCKYLLYNDIFYGTFDSLVPETAEEKYLQFAEILQQIAERDSEFGYLFETLQQLCMVLSIKAQIGIEIYQNYHNRDREKLEIIGNETITELLNCIEDFQQKFRYQWQKENKSFGYEIQLIRLGALKERLKYAKEQIRLWVKGGIDVIEELEQERLPFAYYETTEPDKVNYNVWSNIVSPSVVG